MTDLWVYPIGRALGSERIEAERLIEEHGPVREGFLDKTGFRTLFWSGAEQTGLSMAAEVLEPEREWLTPLVDGIVYVTSTGDLVAPGNAHLLQSRLGLSRDAMLLDLNDACTGFVRALRVAQSLIESGAMSTVLLAMSDTYSKLFGPDNLRVSPLFSDGATAILLSAAPLKGVPERIHPRRWEIVASWFRSDGARAEELRIAHDDEREFGDLSMNGAGVLNFVLSHLRPCLAGLEEQSGTAVGDVDRWYVHQGSRTVVGSVEKTLGKEQGSLFRSADYGNTVSSSLPFMLMEDDDEAGRDELIGLLAFGVGLTIAGALIRQHATA